MKDQHKALKAIEIITSDNFIQDLEYLLYVKDVKVDPKLKIAADKLLLIYRIVHAEISDCHHEGWEDEKYKIIEDNKLK